MGRGAALHNWKPRHETQENSGPWPRLSQLAPAGTGGPAEPAIQPTQKGPDLSTIHIYEPTRQEANSYAVFSLKEQT